MKMPAHDFEVHRVRVHVGQGLGQEWLEAGALLEFAGDLAARLADRAVPTGAALIGLVLPFQKMGQQHVKAAHQFAAFFSAHAVQCLGQVVEIDLVELVFAHERCGLEGRLAPSTPKGARAPR